VKVSQAGLCLVESCVTIADEPVSCECSKTSPTSTLLGKQIQRVFCNPPQIVADPFESMCSGLKRKADSATVTAAYRIRSRIPHSVAKLEPTVRAKLGEKTGFILDFGPSSP